MPRRYGYAPIGKPCHGLHPWHSKGRTKVIGALLDNRLLTVARFSGSINADVFFAWVTQDWLPQLPSNSLIVMDNASFHQRSDIRSACLDAGHFLRFLPPSSPDLNPLEHKWAQAKMLRQRLLGSTQQLFANPLLF